MPASTYSLHTPHQQSCIPPIKSDSQIQAVAQETAQDSKRILNFCSYRRKDLDLALARSGVESDAVACHSFRSPFPRRAESGLGDLGNLPLNIVLDIVSLLDYESIFRLRQVNQRAREIVSAIPEYRITVSNALQTWCTLLKAGVGHHVALSRFYRMLSTEKCHLCGSFGGYVFLPNFSRCCFECISSAPELTMISITDGFVRPYKLKLIAKAKVPILHTPRRSVPTKYGSKRRGDYIVSEQAVHDLVRKHHGRGPGTTSQALYGSVGSLGGRHLTSDIRSTDGARSFSFVASTPFPVYNPTTKSLETGVSCRGCRARVDVLSEPGNITLFGRFSKIYSEAQYLKHFKTCKLAQKIWSDSEAKKEAPAEPAWSKTGHTLKRTWISD